MKEFTRFLEAGRKAIRFSSVLSFTSATVVGAILAGCLIDFGTVWLLVFSASSTSFGFVVNDLSDAELDRSGGVLRNPVSTEELSPRRCILLAFLLLVVSSAALLFSSLWDELLGLLVICLYSTYSWLVRAKARPILDIAYHGVCPAILATMGYIEYRSSDIICFLLASLVFVLSAVSQILQEIRDYETDRKVLRTTVVLLGKTVSLILCLVFYAIAFVICLILIFYGVLPLEILLMSPPAFFIIAPIIRVVRKEEREDSMLREIRETQPFLVATLITILILKSV